MNNENKLFGNSEQPQFPDLIKAGLKVGDKVYSYLYGEGEVQGIGTSTYPIYVKFANQGESFTRFGLCDLLDLIPSIHLQPWNPIAGEPFPFPKFEPIVGEKYGFWGNGALIGDVLVIAKYRKYEDKLYFIEENPLVFENCAPISEAMQIFGFNKVGEVEP